MDPIQDTRIKFPGPQKYKISRQLLKTKKWGKKAPYSSFAKKVEHGVSRDIGWVDRDKVRSSLEMNMQMRNSVGKKWPKVEEIKNNRLPQIEPGPGDYEVGASTDAIVNYNPQSIKGNSSFLPSRTRFALQKDQVMNPGPGEYVQKGTFNDDKYKVYGAVFMSETSRQAFDIKKQTDRFAPYTPSLMKGRESFHVNLDPTKENRVFIV